MNVAIIGAGHGGTKLINLFSEMDNVNVALVVDKDYSAVGIQLANEKGIRTSQDIHDIKSLPIDLVVEATGNETIKKILAEALNKNIKLIDSDVAKMLMTTVDKQADMTERLNTQLETIKETTESLEREVSIINESSEALKNVSDRILGVTKLSGEYILKSDDIIKAVNKITQQIKILGLNANIEAARAGEHGRGFAVVATEVQKLSDTTSNFAEELSNLLQSLSHENSNLVNEVNKLEGISEKEVNISENVNIAIEQLAEKTR